MWANLRTFKYSKSISPVPLTGNAETKIRFALPRPGFVKRAVYDVLGKEVAVLVDKAIPAGINELKFDGKGLASGIYIFRLHSGEYSSAIKRVVSR